MNHKGIYLITALVSLLAGAFQTKAQPFGSANDLWDVSQGTTVTSNTGVQFSSATYMFGGGAGTEGSTYFPDAKTNGFIHAIEWRTAAPVTVGRLKLYAIGDGAGVQNGREFARFTLKIKSPGSTNFNQTVCTFVPTHPYAFMEDHLILNTAFGAVVAQEFRAEFEHVNLRSGGFNGPRVVELDGFPPDGPLAYYQLNGNGFDSTANQLHGTVHGAVAAQNRFGETNSALSFNGVSNYVTMGNPPAFNFASNFTVTAWVKLNGPQPKKYFIAKYAGGDGITVPPHSFGLGLEDGTSRLYGFVAGNGPGFAAAAGGASLGDGAWHTVTMAYDNSFGIRLYVDGAAVASQAAAGLAPFVNSAPLTIGGLEGQQFVDATIDSVRIFDQALSEAQIQTDYYLPPDAPLDLTAPVVTIVSPASGVTSNSPVSLAGSITDNRGVVSNRWEFNGAPMGSLTLSNGAFSVPSLPLNLGENRFKVFASDAARNEASAEVAVIYNVPATSGTNGLIAHYPLDGNGQDISGHQLHGVLHGTAPTGGRFGGTSSALAFDGMSDYVNCSNPPAFYLGANFSILTWVKLNGAQPTKYIVAKYTQEGAPHSFGLGTEANVNSRAYAFVSGNGPGWFDCQGGPSLNDGNWHALGFTYDNGFGIRLYVDGILAASRPAAGLAPFINSESLSIGGLTWSQFFGGAIDDVRIYGRTLSGAEIQAQYEAGSQLQIGVADDLFDVQRGTVLTASSGLQSSSADPGMLGGSDEPRSPRTTTFADDKPNGFTHFTEWRTAVPVTVSQIKLYAEGDGSIYDNGREFGQFTLKAKSPGSAVFDRTLVTFSPSHPYAFSGDRLILDTNFTAVTAQEFRGEFEQINLRAAGWNAPRVIELDAFGPPPSEAPAIFQQPGPVQVLAGATATFAVSVLGTSPFDFQWRRDGTNVSLSSRVQSPDGKTLLINNVSAADVGAYSVVVTNQHGLAESQAAALTLIADTNAPMVAISSPSSGPSGVKTVVLEGNISDNYGVVSAHWERNGVNMGTIGFSNGTFRVESVQLLPGENRLRVVASDSTGNQGFAEIALVLSPTAQADDDLWDVSRGTVVTATSGTFSESSPGMFGGAGWFGEGGGRTIFADDKTNGFTHFIEWRTANGVTVSNVRLFAGGDGPGLGNGREFARFTLKAKSPGSSNFNVTVFSFAPNHPYAYIDSESLLMFETNFPAFTAQEFRGEFEQVNLRSTGNGPRILELDAFGPSSSGPPEIVSQPASVERFTGSSAGFLVGVTGAGPLAYQWRHAGTNLLESAKFVGVNTWSLRVNNLTAADAGGYSVVVTNALGGTNSQAATLSISIDSMAPIVAITSPVAGGQTNGTFVLEGTVVEANAIESVRVEINQRAPQQLTLANGTFRVTGLNFDLGENHIKVIATDISGNIGTNEVVTTWTVPRALVLLTPMATQDGGMLTVPVILISTGGVSGATFTVDFDANYLTNAVLEWNSSVAGAFTSVNLEAGKRLRATFALAGTTLPAGSVPVATLSFRARSVPANLQTQLTLGLAGVYSETGDLFESNNSSVSTVARINKRKITGDNNANDLLDVGDASFILRLVTGLEPTRTWDRTLNDLNRSGNVDSGDVIRVLRAVVELDPQPTVPLAPASAGSFSALSLKAFAADPVVTLTADKLKAAPGEKVTLEVRLANQTAPVSGVSFRIAYPPTALRIDSTAARSVGSLAPAGVASAWNVSPADNFASQDGSVSLALSSPTIWPSSNGVVARITFTVQAGAAAQTTWPVQLQNLVIGRDAGLVETADGASWTFTRATLPARFASSVTFVGQTPRITVQGDVGASYRVEASTNLFNWDFIGTIAGAAPVNVDDPAGAGARARFYRAILQ